MELYMECGHNYVKKKKSKNVMHRFTFNWKTSPKC